MEDSRPWTSRETKCFLALWSDATVQSKLDSSYRNRPIFEDIARNLQAEGYSRTWLQCQRKIKHLKALYKRVKEGNDRGESGRIICPFYKELDQVLDERAVARPIVVRESASREDPKDASVTPGPSVKTEGLDSVIKMEESPDDCVDDNDIGSTNPSTSEPRDEPRDCIGNGEDADEYADPTWEEGSRRLHNIRHRESARAPRARAKRSNLQKMESQLNGLGERFLAESRREFEAMMSRDREWLEEERLHRREERQEQHRIWRQEWRECQATMTALTPGLHRNRTPAPVAAAAAPSPCGLLGAHHHHHHGDPAQAGYEGRSPKPQSHVLQAVLLLMKELGSEELQVVCRTAQDRFQSLHMPPSTAHDRPPHGGPAPGLHRPPSPNGTWTDLIQHLGTSE